MPDRREVLALCVSGVDVMVWSSDLVLTVATKEQARAQVLQRLEAMP